MNMFDKFYFNQAILKTHAATYNGPIAKETIWYQIYCRTRWNTTPVVVGDTV